MCRRRSKPLVATRASWDASGAIRRSPTGWRCLSATTTSARALPSTRCRSPNSCCVEGRPRGDTGYRPGMTDVNRQLVLARRPVGAVEDSDFELRETAAPEPGPGEFLVRVLWISFDPAQR